MRTAVAGIFRFFVLSILLVAIPTKAQQIAAWGNSGAGQAWVPSGLTNVKTAVIEGGSGLALLKNGRLAAWGSNDYGQTNFPANATNIIAIARSSTHTIGLRDYGAAFVWGSTPSLSSSATNLSVYSNVRQIAAGFGFSLLLQGGQVRQVPGSVVQAFVVAIPSAASSLSDVRQISAGDDVAIALRSNGTFVVWGNPDCTNFPAGLSDVKTVAAGNDHITALRSNGTVVAWGFNSWHQTNVPVGLSNVVAIDAGAFHNLALRSDGSIVGWGDGWYGEAAPPNGLTNIIGISARGVNSIAIVGDSPLFISKQPKGQTVFPGANVTLGCTATGFLPLSFQWQRDGLTVAGATNSILRLTNVSSSATGSYTVVISDPTTNITSDIASISLGNLASWGSNGGEQCEVLADLTNISNISAGNGFSMALRLDGTVARWGANKFGFPGSKSNVVSMASGGQHALFVHTGGNVSTWGEDVLGQTEIPPNLSNVLAVAAGNYLSAALKEDQTVVAWGQNLYGKTNVPSGLSNVTAIACGYDYTVALKSDGKVVAWGNNNSGQTNVPGNLSNVVAIASAASSALALKFDGTLQAWGGGISVPNGISNIVAISAHSFANALALRSDGTVIAFGNDNGAGQNIVPTGVTNIMRIASGFRHNMALVGDGSPTFPTAIISRSVTVGETLQLPALAAGVQLMTYQWQFNGEPIDGQTASILSISNILLNSTGDYRVVASNSFGVSTGAVTRVTAVRGALCFATEPGKLSITNGMMNFSVTGLAGSGPVVLSASTNLTSWQPIMTNDATVGALNFAVPLNDQLRFFRVSEY